MNPVCVTCQIELKTSCTGALLIEIRNVPNHIEQQFYRAWYAEIFQCPKCKHEVDIHFARTTFLEHFEPQAVNRLELEKSKAKRVVINNER